MNIKINKFNQNLFSDLTWRDLQHLVIRTARPKGLLKAEDWRANAAGLQVIILTSLVKF